MSRTVNVGLIWTARQKAFIQEICKGELTDFLGREDFEAEFFTTGSSSAEGTSLLSEETLRMGEVNDADLPAIEIRHERPDIRSIILDTAKEESLAGAKLAVLVCGPAGMADEARDAVHRAMKSGCKNVSYFEEAFGW